MKFKTLILSLFFNAIVLAPAIATMCHFKDPRQAGESLSVAMDRAKECSWGNTSGNLYFILTFAEMLHKRGQLPFDPIELKIDGKYLGNIDLYEKSYEAMLLSERQSIESMFWLQLAYHELMQPQTTVVRPFNTKSMLRHALINLYQSLEKAAKTAKQKELLDLISEEQDLTDTNFGEGKTADLRNKTEQHKRVKMVAPAMLKKTTLYDDIKNVLIHWPILPYRNCMTRLSRKCAKSLETALTDAATCKTGNAVCLKRFIATSIEAFPTHFKGVSLKDLGLTKNQVGNVSAYKKSFQNMKAAQQSTFIIYVQGLILEHLYNQKSSTSAQNRVMKNIQDQFLSYYRQGKTIGAKSNFMIMMAQAVEDNGQFNISKFVENINTFKALLT